MKTILRVLIWVPLVVLVAGCAMSFEYGRWPDPNALDKLRLGQSDSVEILRVLGEPTGRGESRMPDSPDRAKAAEILRALGSSTDMGESRMPDFPDKAKATVWSYEYQRISGAPESETEINLLLVFLWKDVYVGHFWFEVDDKMLISKGAR